MNGQEFFQVVSKLFGSFLTGSGFRLLTPPSISGRLYKVDFDGANNVISISYEPGDDYLLIVVFQKTNGGLSDIDDRTKTLSLSDLNARFMPSVTANERQENNVFFAWFQPALPIENRLLKQAKDLRLCIKHLLGYRASGSDQAK